MTHAATTLVLGGARSGKSRLAEALVCASGFAKVYVATAEAGDGEMRERIAHHRERRGAEWRTIEEPLQLTEVISREATSGRILLVDCLTLWTSNLMLADRDIPGATDALIAAVAAAAGPVILVANEVGWGIVPDNALARRFRDEAGRLNQAVAAAVTEVQLVVAGLPLRLVDRGSRVP